MRLLAIFLIVLLSTIVACDSGKKEKSIEHYWRLFERGQYLESREGFLKLVDDEGSDAYTGAGWSSLRLGDFEDADNYFSHVSSSDLAGQAGWAFTKWTINDPEGALEKAEIVLSSVPNYTFPHDTRIDRNDLIWIEAASYLQLGNNGMCLARIQALNPNFTVNLIDPAVEQMLLAELQRLGAAN